MVASGVLRTSYFVHSHRSHVASILVHTGYLWIWLDLVSPPPLFLPPRSYQGPTSQGRHAPSTDRSERLTKGIERESIREVDTEKRGRARNWMGRRKLSTKTAAKGDRPTVRQQTASSSTDKTSPMGYRGICRAIPPSCTTLLFLHKVRLPAAPSSLASRA